MKTPIYISFAALALFASQAYAQTLTNGSFETTVGPVSYSSSDTTPTVNIGGWTVNRNSLWLYDSTYERRVQVFDGGRDQNPYGWYIDDENVLGGASGTMPPPTNNPAFAYEGSSYLGIYNDFAPITTNTGVSTEISGLVSGQTYEVSYYFAAIAETNEGTYDIDLEAYIDNALGASHGVMNFTDNPSATGPGTGIWQTNSSAWNVPLYTEWTKGSFTFTASSASSVLEFVGLMQGGPAQLQLDNVTVAAVPETSSALLGLLAGSCAIFHRRRRLPLSK